MQCSVHTCRIVIKMFDAWLYSWETVKCCEALRLFRGDIENFKHKVMNKFQKIQ